MSTFFFFNDTATTEIYTLSLHDALPIFSRLLTRRAGRFPVLSVEYADAAGTETRTDGNGHATVYRYDGLRRLDRKSTRLNSSHANTSYAVFCLKKKTRSSPCSCRPVSRR